MRTLPVVEFRPHPDHPLRIESVRQFMQVHRFELYRPPQPFDEHVVQTTTPTVCVL